ncbi:MAG: ribonuclease P protein component [Chitinophagaceae bacterium]|nr:ribonuclease P protein component [Chitinophagaceae bacterium]
MYHIKHLYTLRKSERLKGRKNIDRLFNEGFAFNEPPVRAVYLLTQNHPAVLRTGFSVSKRKFRKAVQRNRIKRLMREAWRLNCVPLKDILKQTDTGLSAFLIFTGNDMPDYNLTEQKIKRIINKLLLSVEKFSEYDDNQHSE